MNATGVNAIVPWHRFKSTNTRQRNISIHMLSEEGVNISAKKGRDFVLVNYDRGYVLRYLYEKVIKPLGNPDISLISSLLEEAQRLDFDEQ